MYLAEINRWIQERDRRLAIIKHLHQPMTVLQVATRHAWDLDQTGYALWELRSYRLVECLNTKARASRVYWLTDLGRRCQLRLRKTLGLSLLPHSFPTVDWSLYGWVCHRHRRAIIKSLVMPLQPAVVKRRARIRDETLRMSANNAREVMKLFHQRGVVKRVEEPGERYPKYELTSVGLRLRTLLHGAEAVPA